MLAASAFLGCSTSTFRTGQQVQAPALRACRPLVPFSVEAAHKKGAGSTKNGRDSVSKRRGVKVYGGQPVSAGGIIIRQLGTKVGGRGRAGGGDMHVCGWRRAGEARAFSVQLPAASAL